jgi:branched-chain amino acid transport system substrate-binding protein
MNQGDAKGGNMSDESQNVSRREFLKIAGIAGAAVGAGAGLGGLLAACGGEETTTTAAETSTTAGAETTTTVAASTTTASAGPETGREIKIGYVAPLTGMLAVFGVADQYCYDRAQEGFADGVVCGDGMLHPVSITMEDGQSDSNRAAQVAGDLINNTKVDIIMAASTGINVAPVADQAEANGVPCLSTDCPWQNYVFPRGGDPTTEWQWTYNAFWGTEDIIATFMDIWSQVPTNKKVAIMLPNDALGIPWLAAFQEAVPAAGWDAYFTDLYQPGTEDYSAEISAFKSFGAEIIFCEANPPDFTTFWTQCLQQGFQPKVNSPAVALAFPEDAAALGDLAENLCGELGWHPQSPFTSAFLGGETAQQFADTFTETTQKQWNQSLSHFIVFDWVYDVLTRTTNVDDKNAIIETVRTSKLDTIGGPIDFTGPVEAEIRPGIGRVTYNCYKTPLFGNQWRKATAGPFPYEATIVSNVAGSMVPVQDSVREMVYS